MTDQNKNNYEKFKGKWTLWQNCLAGEDRHALYNQITRMLWDMAVFIIINESRKQAEQDGTPLNGMVHGMIDRCFFESQMLAIRRLVDRRSDVYSLSSLLEDIRKNTHLLTRENIFQSDGLPYDPKPIRCECDEWIANNTKPGEAFCLPEKYNRIRYIEEQHKTIDIFSCTTEANRSTKDKIQAGRILTLKCEVEKVCDNVRNHVNKHIAHASTPESRSTINSDATNVTLNSIFHAHEIICEVSSYLRILLRREILPFFPTPQFNHFENIDRSLIMPENIGRLQETWNVYEEKVNGWNDEIYGKLEKRLAQNGSA